MRKLAVVGAVVFAILGSSSLAMAESSQGSTGLAAEQTPTLTPAQIARFRGVLRLRSDQQQYWPAVAHVLGGMVRQASSARTGLVQRLSAKASDMLSDASRLRQLAAAAKPLVESLDGDQKFAALQFVNDMGYGAVVAAF